jgi:GH18 family chitinase
MEEQDKKRTLTQNRALHKYFGLLSDELNTLGLDMKTVLKPEVEIAWSSESVKNYLWRPIQKVMLEVDSTKDLNTKQIDKVFDVLNRHIGEKFGVHIAFPSIEEVINQQR